MCGKDAGHSLLCHHPIFRGKPLNYDPRERFIAEILEKHGDYNVFHAFYRDLVQALYETGASRYVFCVNVDAVIAALLLVVLWKDYRSGALTEKDLETAAFNVFLFGRMIGAAAEIDDHLNRGPRWNSVRSSCDASIAIISEQTYA